MKKIEFWVFIPGDFMTIIAAFFLIPILRRSALDST
jgi:hypothetical protein